MIYQLAKTSPLLTGQVKMNMIMSGNKVVDLQYTPISNYITFNYNNSVDVLNYSHADNVKFLYNKISDSFFNGVSNPVLTTKQLHRYDTLVDDTHENTYEMGMKRLEYQRYKKQFEFFCPFWCDSKKEFDDIVFTINLVNKNGRIMYSDNIEFDSKISGYIKNILPSLGINEENKELVFISFNDMSSYIKGLNAEKGVVQTIDTSYLVKNLLERERPIIETDNMILSTFSQNKIVCTQIFNYNFVFDLYDFIPISLLNDLICERVNIYIDMYKKDSNGNLVKIEVKDIYSNYEHIPRYDIYKNEYDKNFNVLDYLEENNSLDFIDKNKLVQSTFHWALQSKQDSIFNLYNGFAPVNTINKENISCNSISNNAPDLFTDTFDLNKNPFGIFKFTYVDENNTPLLDFSHALNDDNNYYSIDIKNINEKSKEFQFFGNILISNEKIGKYIESCPETDDILKKFGYCVFAKKEKGKFDDECNINNKQDVPFVCVGSETGEIEISSENSDNLVFVKDIAEIKCGIFKIPNLYTYKKIRDFLDSDYMLTKLGYLEKNGSSEVKRSDDNFLLVKYNNDSGTLYVSFLLKYDIKDFLKNISNTTTEVIKNNVSFYSLFNNDYIEYYLNQFYSQEYLKNMLEEYFGAQTYIALPSQKIEGIYKEDQIKCYTSQEVICYTALNFVASLIKYTKFPNSIVYEHSFATKRADSPSIKSTETELIKSDKYSQIYRYDSNLIPMFISLDDQNFKNNVYWCKQYDKTIYNTLQSFLRDKKQDIDRIGVYSNIALKKFSPLFKSIEYFVLNSKEIDYNIYYLYDKIEKSIEQKNEEDAKNTTEEILNIYNYKKEISWYKNNSMIYLPPYFESEYKTKTGENPDIVEIIYSMIQNNTEYNEEDLKILVEYYIKNLYLYEYTYDYLSETDITKQKYKIKFTLK